jgi:hypothetical protein
LSIDWLSALSLADHEYHNSDIEEQASAEIYLNIEMYVAFILLPKKNVFTKKCIKHQTTQTREYREGSSKHDFNEV